MFQVLPQQAEVELNETTEGEKNKLAAELEKLRVGQQKLERKVAKYEVYEDFPLKTGGKLPDKHGGDPVVRAIIRKHETLSAKNQNTIMNVILSDDYKKSQHDLEALLWEHDTTKIMLSELSPPQMVDNSSWKRPKRWSYPSPGRKVTSECREITEIQSNAWSEEEPGQE
ncbi:LOW QUALITY PROTEIN: uncharacterized protein CCDC197 [Pluvialis apricaria]